MATRRHKRSPKINRRTLDQLRNTVAITLDTPKTCALIFEKIVSTTAVAHEAPAEILIYRRAQQWKTFPLVSGGSSGPEEERRVTFTAREGMMIGAYAEPALRYVLNNQPDQVCSRITDVGFRPVLCYTKQSEENQVFRAGDKSMIVACVKGLGIVDEDQLTWPQVMEFRKDHDSRAHVARFMNWLNEKWEGKNIEQIQEHLGELYEARQSAFAKFGIRFLKDAGESFFAVTKESISTSTVTLGAMLTAVVSAAGSDKWLAAGIATGFHLFRSLWIGARETKAAFEEEHKAMALFYGLADRFNDPMNLGSNDPMLQLGRAKE